jgi:hypothetical protein
MIMSCSTCGYGQAGDAPYWAAQRRTDVREAALAAADRSGAPYTVPPGWHEGWVTDYAGALAIARSGHPSRVLANTNGYRYGRFEERADGAVTVTMMGSHIATFHPNAVELWWRGYVTVSSTEALGNLCSAGWFYAEKGKIMFRSWDGGPDSRLAEDGGSYSYRQAGPGQPRTRYCGNPGHGYGDHSASCMPPADPSDPELRLLRAIFGLCPLCDRAGEHEHEEVDHEG